VRLGKLISNVKAHFRATECEYTHHRDYVDLPKVGEMSDLKTLEVELDN
jgi:hypothetical protein